MLVRHFCYYLTDWSGITPRRQDYDTSKVVRCLKGDAVKGYFDASIGDISRRFDDSNKSEFLRLLWDRVGTVISGKLDQRYTIVPIPNRTAVVGAKEIYRTLSYARAIAAASKGKLDAVDALRWKLDLPAAHSQKGVRTPEPRYENLSVANCPQLPIVLFDDVITSGSSFVAACWRLEEAGNRPIQGLAIARRTAHQETKIFGLEERDLEIPGRPMF